MIRRVHLILRPSEVDEKAWISFLNNKCSQCEEPKDGCTDDLAVIGQARKCFKEWIQTLAPTAHS